MKRIKLLLLALAIALTFAIADQYVMNLSSYGCGGLLAWLILEKRKGEAK